MDKREALIYLTEAGVIPYDKRLIWYADQTSKSIWEFLSADESRKLKSFEEKYPYTSYETLYQNEKIQPIVLGDEKYPKWLAETYKPPLVLFCQGHVDYLNANCLSVVGSRKMTAYGKEAMRRILPPILDHFTIVSGPALGVDSEAHRICIEHHAKTIAVIGTGLYHSYPNAHALLQKEISKNQLLVSLLPYYAGVKKWHFPYRNQTIAGLSKATLVVEAAEKSGSLITANYALQENRDVFAIPGNIDRPYSKGCNQLIQSGAKMVLKASDILEEF